MTRSTPSPLIERGGIALVEFHLARRGIESIRTQQHSARGDIWAEAPIGRISIEVKTTAKSNGWFVSRGQHASEIYCLVHLESARVWVVTAGEIDTLLRDAADIHPGKIARIIASSLPRESLEAWEKIGGLRMATVYRAFGPRKSGRALAGRTVKHTLSDGTVKVYRYDRHVARKALPAN
jgi:hypothetical protein